MKYFRQRFLLSSLKMFGTTKNGLKMKNFGSWKPKQIFGCPYFRKEGGGQEEYQNVLILYILNREEGRGLK